ncbi:MAG: pilus assembly protein N-terminal domain-containing protein [Selenomonadaceae bacterium]|nr:pilus assembly protein N-terminal domain-containing protein [Selenomonadaceae bacterium]
MNSFIKKFCLAAVPFFLSASVVQAAEFETLNIKKQTSHYMDMGQRITRIAVGDPSIATVVQLPGSANEFLIVTKATQGSTALFVWTLDGARHQYNIVVSPEDPGQAMMIEKAIGLPDVHVKYVDGRLLLTGTVENQYEKNYALQTARLFVNSGTESSLLVGSGFDMKLDTDTASSGTSGRDEDIELAKSEAKGAIIDLIQILHPTQIRLEAQIIEIDSDATKNLGLQYGTSGSGGVFSFGEDYSRSNTSISESSSSGWSNSYSGNNSSSGSSSNSSSSDRSWASNDNPYTDEYNYDYSNSTSNSSRNGSNNYSGSNDYSGNSSFSRSVTSTWQDLRRFGNNPIKWITQHFAPINATLTALVTNGKAKILSRPSVMTLSGEQATIQIGGRIPYEVSTMSSSDVKEIQYGIILQFKPVVDAQNRINSAVHAEVSSLGGQTSDGRMTILTRSADSVVSLNSGMPIVIGGLMNSEETKNITKIPLLGDIPILGEFFKHTSKSRDNRELIIVVTPYLVESEEISRSPMSQPMREWYDQNEKQRETMESHDFKPPEPEVVIEEEPERILPPAKYPKNGKMTDTPFK